MYADVFRIVAVVRGFESGFAAAAAAAAAVVYVVVVGVVVVVPACCRPSALNTKHKYIPGTTEVRIPKNKCNFVFSWYELTPRQGYCTRTAISICMCC